MRRLAKAIAAGVVLGGLLVAVLYKLGAPRAEVLSIEKLHARDGVPVEVARPVRMDFTEHLICDGAVTADVQALLRSKIDEVVEAVHVRVGERVEKGQLLVEFRRTDLEEAVKAAEAASEEATANHARYRALFEQEVITEERLDQARTAAEGARASLQAARSRLGFAEIRSPIAGVAEQRFVEPGEYKGVGKELLTIVDLSTVEVRAHVPETDMPVVLKADRAEFQLEAGGEWLSGEVARIAPSTTDPNRFFDVFLKVQNSRVGDHWLMRPGMYAEVRFPRRVVLGAIAVPESSIVIGSEERALYTVQTEEKHVPVPGEPPNYSFTQRLQRGADKVLSGLWGIYLRISGVKRVEQKPHVPHESRQVEEAVRIEVEPGLTRRGLVELVGAPVGEDDLVIIHPRDAIQGGTRVRVIEDEDAGEAP